MQINYLERMREDAYYNRAAAMRNAEIKGEKKAKKRFIEMLKSGKSPEEIIKKYDAKQ